MPLSERQSRHAALLAHIKGADAAIWGRSYLAALTETAANLNWPPQRGTAPVQAKRTRGVLTAAE